MYIGYNIEKINTVMSQIRDAYHRACDGIATEYENIVVVLRREWIGYDEYDFELRLVQHLNKLLSHGKTLCENSIKIVHDLALAWIEFQDVNTLEGNKSGALASLSNKLEDPGLLQFKNLNRTMLEFSGFESFGLSNANSANNIRMALADYVKNVKALFTNLFNSIESNNAFYGNQSLKMKNMIDEVANLLGELNTAINEYEQAMQKLTVKSYSESDAFVSEELKTASGTLGNQVDSLGSARWGTVPGSDLSSAAALDEKIAYKTNRTNR